MGDLCKIMHANFCERICGEGGGIEAASNAYEFYARTHEQ
jgi:hypothetical protein